MRTRESNLRFLNDFAKMMTGAFGSLTEARHNIRTMIKDGVEQVMGEFDMVTRAEFDRVEALAQKARERQIELEKRLEALERGGKAAPKAKAAKSAAKPKPKGKKK